jgi:dipeptide/tripeptide permease
VTALTDRPNRTGTVVFGGVLIFLGLVALATTYTDIDPSRWLGGSGWTLFIIAPGAILLTAGVATTRPPGEGLTIAGAIVTTIGMILLFMDQTGSWESWAYAWALIPGAAGAGLMLRGARVGDRSRVVSGARMGLISLLMLAIGGWYFETIFRTGEPPFAFGDAWPLILIGVGAVVVGAGLVTRPRQEPPTS